MTSPIVMPKLGLTMTEGLLASWRVRPGDAVENGDVLFVVETEKIATEVEAQGAGRIEAIAVAEGDTVPVGAVVATWTGAGPDAEAPSAGRPARPASPGQAAPPAEAAPISGAARIVATPLARRLARGAAIDLRAVKGSGPGGRIKARDIEVTLANGAPTPAFAALPARATRRPATAVEKVVARRLTQAKQTIPHFYVQADADVTRLLALREELKEAGGFPRASLTHWIVAALGRALVATPEMNVLWAEDEIVQLADVDIGIAVETDRGLLAPVLRGADALDLAGIAEAADALIAKARAGCLAATDLEGGAVTVSNVGMYGASHLTPIINPGQSAILGVAAVKPVFRPDAAGRPSLRQELGLVLACDHRVLDGIKAARFLDRLATLLKQPLALLRA